MELRQVTPLNERPALGSSARPVSTSQGVLTETGATGHSTWQPCTSIGSATVTMGRAQADLHVIRKLLQSCVCIYNGRSHCRNEITNQLVT